MRPVNVHEAKTQFSRLIDAAHAGETILVAKDGKPWARLVPLAASIAAAAASELWVPSGEQLSWPCFWC